MGEMIEFPGDDHVDRGYMATPRSGSGPGVVVIQEWWGLVPHITDVCDRFAAAGYTALAPDLYHGRTTTEPESSPRSRPVSPTTAWDRPATASTSPR